MTSGLRTLLRLDPDVVLVGEIRDGETAETAMRAASSGKYVFSSLHTRDVASTVTALRDLHVDNRSLAGNLTGIISQRLVRQLCPKCARSDKPTDREVTIFLANGVEPPEEIRRPVGCDFCRNTGYYERIGIFEVVSSDYGLMNAIEGLYIRTAFVRSNAMHFTKSRLV
jgi:type II secretory ATPase GspE/PulE/Tfp pilus assembly ATPase PilB-like protein